jgi:hypothetical protein
VNLFGLIEAEKADRGNVVKACELVEVSRSASYQWSAPSGSVALAEPS